MATSTSSAGNSGGDGSRAQYVIPFEAAAAEPVARIGGKLTVSSSPDSGTEITVIVPGSIVFRKPITSPLEKIRTILRRIGPASHPD